MAKKQAAFNLDEYLKAQQSANPLVKFKEPDYLQLHPEIQKALSLPGFPLGHMSMLYGLSDSGKTGVLLKSVKAAQQQGKLPVLIVTENKLTKERIIAEGIDLNKLILVEDLKFLESVYDYISMKTQEVLDGDLPMDVVIFWDSVAGCPSKDSYTIKKDGKIEKEFDNRKNANVIGFYNNIIASRIADTRKEGVNGSVTVVFVTQAYVGEKPKFPPGLPAPIVPNGGEKIWFPLSLAIEVRESTRLQADHKGAKVNFGLVSQLTVRKCHISELSSSGYIVLAGPEVLANDKDSIDEFKQTRKDEWTAILDAALQGSEDGED